MPYKKMSDGKSFGKMKGKIMTEAQMQAIEISNHSGIQAAAKPKAKPKKKGGCGGKGKC